MGREYRDRDLSTVVTIGVGFGIGYALYHLLGRGRGVEGGEGGEGRGRAPSPSPAAPGPNPQPAVHPPAPVAPHPVAPAPPVVQRPFDPQPIAVRVVPSLTDPSAAAIEMDGRVVSVGELAARIGEGGRSDVRVAVRGDVRQGGWEAIRDALAFLGIAVLLRMPSGLYPTPVP